MSGFKRTALVTGGTRGIGAAVAAALEAAGHTVYTASRAAGGERHVRVDLAANSGGKHAVEEVLRRARRLDVLVNNAGMQRVAPVEETRADAWLGMVALHMTAPLEAIGAALPGMRERGFGRIVNMASVHGLIGSAGKAPYTATKHGLVGLTRAVAQEVAKDPITCNAVCPGFVRTDIIQDQIDAYAEAHGLGVEAAAREMIAPRQPSGTFVTTEGVASLVAFLASDGGAHVNGAALPIDDGWTAR